MDEQIKVLQMLDKLGYMWKYRYSIQQPTDYTPLENDESNEVIYLDVENKTLIYGDLDYLYEYGTDEEEITYEDLLKQHTKVIL